MTDTKISRFLHSNRILSHPENIMMTPLFMSVWALIITLSHNAVAFTPITSIMRTGQRQLKYDSTTPSAPLIVHAMTTSSDIMDWFLKEPASPIFMNMVKKLPSETWEPIKYQLDSIPMFYCGVEDVQPTTLPFQCFLDVDEAMAELKSLRGGKGFGGGEKDDATLDLLPMMLGDAFENAAVGYSTIKGSLKDRHLALSRVDVKSEDDFVPVFGVKMLVKSEKDGSVITGLTDRLYFDGEQAQQVLKKIVDEQGSEELEYEMFVVSLVKAIEYMILDKESDFKFEFVPPESSLNYLTSKYDV